MGVPNGPTGAPNVLSEVVPWGPKWSHGATKCSRGDLMDPQSGPLGAPSGPMFCGLRVIPAPKSNARSGLTMVSSIVCRFWEHDQQWEKLHMTHLVASDLGGGTTRMGSGYMSQLRRQTGRKMMWWRASARCPRAQTRRRSDRQRAKRWRRP